MLAFRLVFASRFYVFCGVISSPPASNCGNNAKKITVFHRQQTAYYIGDSPTMNGSLNLSHAVALDHASRPDNEPGAFKELQRLKDWYRHSRMARASMRQPRIGYTEAMHEICHGYPMKVFTSLLPRRPIGR